MEKLYHVSNVPNLEILEPRVSTYGKAYVYATKNVNFALLFGSTKSNGDFDGMYGFENGIPYFYEAYEGSFKRRFNGETCYIYEVDPKDFKEGLTSFKGEVVCDKCVKIINCTTIQNVYEYLKDIANKGELKLKLYSNDRDYVEMMNEHIKSRLKGFKVLDRPETNAYKFCKKKFPELCREVELEAKSSNMYSE